MGQVIIQEHTTKNPIQLIGEEAGICYGANTTDAEKNYKRGVDCLVSGHGRTWEYPQVYMVLDGYSARVIRELYTHIGGAPTRLQASTRYIDYKSFEYVVPPTVSKKPQAKLAYDAVMSAISDACVELEELGIPKEDIGMVLPLGMETKVVIRTNLRQLIDMSRQRECTRAYWEFRQMMRDIKTVLSNYSEEWALLVERYFMPKCEEMGYCTEKKSCGRKEVLN